MDFIRAIVFLLVGLFRFVLAVAGALLFVPITLVGDGAKRTPPLWKLWSDMEMTPARYATSRWKKYVYWAFRNPTVGMKEWFTQPIDEPQPNPDKMVRENGFDSDERWIVSGIYWEYWFLRKINWGKYKWFEFRIGWKFVDGNDEFFPTLQFGPRSS